MSENEGIKYTYENEEKYIASGSPEVSIGESIYLEKILSFFPALENKNYQLYFTGQLISLIGTWLQVVAEGFLVNALTHSAFLIGLVAALASLPSLFFSLFGGVITDRFPKKKILLFTQAASMILAFLYGILALIHINVFEICVLAFLLGVVNAVDLPARQAFASDILSKEQLTSGIALNSGVFNAARVIGPAFAGFLIALVQPGGAFIINGVSYIAVIIALLLMKVDMTVIKQHLHPLDAIKEGVSYSWNHPIIRVLLIFTAVISIFGWSYATIMPVIADKTFHVGATGLGDLYAATGLGALLGTIIISIFSKKLSPMTFIIGGNTIFAISLFIFTFIKNFDLALVFLFCTGFGLLTMFITLNTTLQHLVTDHVRGRVMSIYVLMFLGLAPFGSIEIGWLSEKFGTALAIQSGTVIVFAFGLLVFMIKDKIRHAYQEYKENNM